MSHKSYDNVTPDYWVTIGGVSKKGVKNPTSIEGYYLGRTTGPNAFDPSKTKTVFLLKTLKGIAGINGNGNLIVKMNNAESNFNAREGRSAVGTNVVLSYIGEQPSKKGSNMKLFSVTLNPDDFIDVSDLALNTSSESDEVDTLEEAVGEDDSGADVQTVSDEDVEAEALAKARRQAEVKAMLSKGGNRGAAAKTGTR